MSLLVRKDVQLSTDPFTAHHLVVKRQSQSDDSVVMAKRNKPDEESVSSGITSTGKPADNESKGEKHDGHVESQPEVCILQSLPFYSVFSWYMLQQVSVQMFNKNQHFTSIIAEEVRQGKAC